MFPQSNANRPVGSTPRPSRRSPLPSGASPNPLIWRNAIRLTSPSSVSRQANRIAPIIPMGPNPSFIWLFRDGEEYATRMAHPKLLPETPSSLGRGRPTNSQTMGPKILPTTSSPITRATTHAITQTAASGRSIKKAPDYIIVQGIETDYYKDEE